MIPAETRYQTYDDRLLAIDEAFKTWHPSLKGYKHEVLILTNYNNLRRFIDTKSLSSRQVCWTQELSCYHFQTGYHQGKTNKAADALSQYPQQSVKEEETLRADNVKILHRLQSSLTNVNLLSLSTSVKLLPLYQVLLCGTYLLPQFWQYPKQASQQKTL